MQLPLRVALVITIILIAGAGATPASAGVYAVYACDPAHGNVNNSWQSYSNRRGILVYAACIRHRGSLGAWDQGLVTRAMVNRRNKQAKIPRGASARWMFRAPPGAKLMNLSFVGSGCGTLGHASALLVDEAMRYWWYNSPDPTCRAAPRRMHLPLLGNTAALRTWCAAGPCKVGGGTARGWASMRSIAMHVIDFTLPAISVTGGSGVAPGWKRGDVTFQFAMNDNVGIRRASIEGGGLVQRVYDSIVRSHPHGAVPDGEQHRRREHADRAGRAAAVRDPRHRLGGQPANTHCYGRGRQHRSRPADWPVGGRRLGMEFD